MNYKFSCNSKSSQKHIFLTNLIYRLRYGAIEHTSQFTHIIKQEEEVLSSSRIELIIVKNKISKRRNSVNNNRNKFHQAEVATWSLIFPT